MKTILAGLVAMALTTVGCAGATDDGGEGASSAVSGTPSGAIARASDAAKAAAAKRAQDFRASMQRELLPAYAEAADGSILAASSDLARCVSLGNGKPFTWRPSLFQPAAGAFAETLLSDGIADRVLIVEAPEAGGSSQLTFYAGWCEGSGSSERKLATCTGVLPNGGPEAARCTFE